MQVAQSQQPVNLFRYVVVICKDFSVVVRVSIQVAEDSQVWYSSSFLIHFSLGTYSISFFVLRIRQSISAFSSGVAVCHLGANDFFNL